MTNYEKYLLKESGGEPKDQSIGKMITKITGEKVTKIDKKLRVVFHIRNFIDHEDMANFDKIDKTVAMLEKMYPGASVSHEWDKFVVEEL